MPFLTPLYLLGTIAAGIPIILHMVHRRRAQRVLFPTIRFLKMSNERTSRRQRIQDLLLLLLRIALLVLLAFALAQPFFARGSGGRDLKAVILLDNSYSMGTTHERTARFATAKTLADAVIDHLPDGAQAALLLACPPHGHPPPILTDDREKLRREILKAPLSQARADMTAAVGRAYSILAEEKAATQELYVVTDLQRNAWPEPPGQQAAKASRVEPNLVVLDCGREDAHNHAVTELIVRGGARVRGQPVTIQAKVRNYTARTIAVNAVLYVDRAKQANQQLEIPPQLTATASFNHVFAEAGIHSGWVQIDDDSLAVDNRRDFCLQVQDYIPAVLLRTEVPGIPQLDPAFFIAKALDPFAEDADQTHSLVQTTTVPLDQITHDLLTRHKVAILVDPGPLRRSQIAVLRRYVRRGGRLMIFLGPSVRPNDLNALLNAEEPTEALLPATVVEPAVGVVDRKKFRTLINLDYDHPALRIFKGYRLPQTVKVWNHAPVVVPETSPTRILIAMSDGSPFLLENHFHEGRVLLFATCTDPDWSNLAASRFFLPLVHRLVYYLTEREEVESTHLVGRPVAISLRDINHAVTLQVRDPDGEVIELRAEPSGGATRASFEQTDKAGAYSYVVLDPAARTDGQDPEAAKAKAESAFAVNINPLESDLAKASKADLEALLKGRKLYIATSASQLAAIIERMREGIPLRNILLYIVLFIAIFETFFANKVMPALQEAEEARTAPAPGAAPAPAEG